MPRRAPRSRHRNAKLSARGLLTPQWAGLVEVARQTTSAASAIASAHGSRCRACWIDVGRITSSARSRTRAIGEVAAPVAVSRSRSGMAESQGSGPGWVGCG